MTSKSRSIISFIINMDRALKVRIIIAVIVFAGLVCQCKPFDRDEQVVYNVIERKGDISVEKLTRKIKGNEKSPKEIADLLGRTMNKSAILDVDRDNTTVRELLALNKYDSTNITDCTINAIERRQEVCKQLKYTHNLKEYCNSCVKNITEFCRNYPYKRILEPIFSKFDWRPHGDVLVFSKNVSDFIANEGNEERPVKENIDWFMENKDDNYTEKLKKHCESFKNEVKSKLYHFGSSSDTSVELLKDIDENIYTIWERCKAIGSDDGGSNDY